MRKRPVVIHAIGDPSDAGSTAALVAGTSGTRAVIAAIGPVDVTGLVAPILRPGPLRPDHLRALARRHRAALLHAHDATTQAAVATAARALGRPWVASAGRPDEVEDALRAGAALVVVPRADLLRSGPVRHVPPAHGAEPGSAAADLEEHYRAVLATGSPAPQRVATADLPTVSVIVATRDRHRLLAALLRALEQQTYPAGQLEVVVVDNGSTDGTADLLAGYAGPLRLVHLSTDDATLVPAARSAAIAASTGEIIAMTDDDCRPTPGWIAALVAGFREGIDIVQGRTEPDPAQPLLPLSRSQWTLWEHGLYETCNIAYRRAALGLEHGPAFRDDMPEELLRLFGPRFRFPFGEDVELAWRLRREGAQTRFSSTAVVHHEVSPPELRQHLRRSLIGTGWPLLVRRNPELRHAFLWGRVFLGPQRPLYLLAGVGAVLCTRSAHRPRAALLALPWVIARTRPWEGGLHVRVRALPAEAVIEAATTVALVRGSVGAKSVVL